MHFHSRLAAACACAVAFPCAAQPSSAPPLWEIGAVGLVASQQAYPGANQQINRGLALPFLIYRGDVFRVDRGNLGIRAVKTPEFEIDIGVGGSFGSSSRQLDARRGMPDLGTLVEVGPRLKWNIAQLDGGARVRAEFPLRGVFDLDDRLASKGAVFEPELSFGQRESEGWSYAAAVGAVWGDRRLASTFYGVAPVYAGASRSAYTAASGLIAWRLSATVSRKLSQDIRLFGYVRTDSVQGAANAASPLVLRKDGVSAGMVLAYTWKQSEARATD
ncbi:MAG: MipA/OmpV family protein [Burkholderiaceae bacterium]